MSQSVTLMHITDIHLSIREKSWGTLGALSDQLFRAAIEAANTQADLDAVIITGDVLDGAVPGEVARLNALLADLEKPWHFVPGNHDGYIDPEHPEAYAPHEALPLFDPRLADPSPAAQRAFWSRGLRPGIQLIGLDSRIADDWDGVIDQEQLAWLQSELEARKDDLVIIAVHHPLTPLIDRDTEPWWSNFILSNGAEVETVLDAYPNVKLVLAGHHHLNRIIARQERLHVNTGALGGYPCEYRVIRLEERAGRWWASIKTESPADAGQIKLAEDMLAESGTAARYHPDDTGKWAVMVYGSPADRAFEGWL